MTILSRAVAVIAAVFSFAAGANAAVTYDGNNTMTISGNTTRFQVMQVVDILAKHDIKRVRMFGNGGDFYAGLAIGQALRSEGVKVVQIPTNQWCVSACAFAALGAERIWSSGHNLMFHRAYMPYYRFDTSLEDISKSAQNIGAVTSAYVLSMGYPYHFINNIIMQTSPCKFLTVNGSQLAKLKDTEFFTHTVYAYKTRDLCHLIRR